LAERLVFVNGLPTLYSELKKVGKEEIVKTMVKEFLNRTFSSDIDEKVERFLQVPSGIFLADTPYFRIFWEFNQIYIAGLYYTTVVTAGVLCERVCLDILEKNKVKPEKKRPCLGDLINLISKNKFAKPESIAKMKKIREKRNEYVHPKMTALDNEKDAFEMVKSITTILQNELKV
jgi:hypothetical protein